MEKNLIVGGCNIQLVVGDITDQQVDAIVNAANSQLAGGGGVDGAIHRAGGPSIMAETREKYPEGCPAGMAVPSAAGDLPAKYVFHAVGPIWHGGERAEDEVLSSAYHHCLKLARDLFCESIAFPSLSTGAYRFPVDEAARIALQTTIDFLNKNGRPELVRFVLFNQDIYDEFAAAMDDLT